MFPFFGSNFTHDDILYLTKWSLRFKFNWIITVASLLFLSKQLDYTCTLTKNGAYFIRGRTLLEVFDTFSWNFRGAYIIRGGTL